MFTAGVWFGWYAVDDLEKIPTPPESLSRCAMEYTPEGNYSPQMSNYNYFEQAYSEECKFNKLESAAGVSELLNELKPFDKKLAELSLEQANIEKITYETSDKLINLKQQYELSVEETSAKLSHKIYSVPELQKKITTLQEKLNTLEKQKKDLQSKINQVTLDRIPTYDKIKAAYLPIFKEQNWKTTFYKFKIFLIQLIFIAPLFYFSLKRYLKLLAKNSPYTIIFTTIVGIMGVLVLRIFFQMIHGEFLAHILESLFKLFNDSELIRSLVFYGGMILSLLIFGGSVYWIQKRLFDPSRVTVRRFRLRKCPSCESHLDLAGNYCPNCGIQILVKCTSCTEKRFLGLPFCPKCGAK